MSFNSMMYHDEIHIWLRCWPARQQQEQSGQIQNELKKAWWIDQKYDEIPKVAICTR